MRCRRCVVWAVGASCLVMAASAARADGPAPSAKEAQQIAALVETIDRLVAEKWAEADITPAAPADDAEFLRRVSLDIAGKIPTVAEARAFLDDPAPDKRPKAVERLLAGPAYVDALHPVLAVAAAARGRRRLQDPGSSRPTSRPGSGSRSPRTPATTRSPAS